MPRVDVMTSLTEPTTPALPLDPGTWTVDTNHSSVAFTIRHLGVSKVRGTFASFDADVQVGATLDTTSVTATVDVASVDTGNTDRDAHILQPDMLDVTIRPTLTFRSTSISGAGDEWRLDGELTIGEVTAPVTLDVELGGVAVFPADGRRHAGFEATTQIRRQDFGLMPGIPAAMLGDVVKIELDLQLVEPAGTA